MSQIIYAGGSSASKTTGLFGLSLVELGVDMYILVKLIGAAIPFLAGYWVLADAKRKGIPGKWWWSMGAMLLTVVVFPVYLLYRRKFKDETKGSLGEKERGIYVGLYLVIPLVLFFVMLVFVILPVVFKTNLGEFVGELVEEKQRWLEEPAQTNVTYRGNVYVKEECYEEVPRGWKYIAKHVKRWKIYVPKSSPVNWMSNKAYPEIILDNYGRWICLYWSVDKVEEENSK